MHHKWTSINLIIPAQDPTLKHFLKFDEFVASNFLNFSKTIRNQNLFFIQAKLQSSLQFQTTVFYLLSIFALDSFF